MRSTGSTTLTLPPFQGWTRTLVLANLFVFFAGGVLSFASPTLFMRTLLALGLVPALVGRGWVWQPFTYSFMNSGLLDTALGLLTLWFTASYLEESRGARWLRGLYLGSAFAAGFVAVALVYLLRLLTPHFALFGAEASVYAGLYAPLFAVLVAFGVLYGDVEFLMFFVVRLRAKYLVAILVLWRIGSLLYRRDAFSATVELLCGLYAFLYVRNAKVAYSNRSLKAQWTERYYGWQNGYLRWKRRRAAKDFQVYMRKQDREVHFDTEGRYVAPEDEKRRDPNDKRWMN